MKQLKFLFLAVLVSASAVAQDEEEDSRDYGATPEDSVKCVRYLSLYGEFYKQDNYKDAFQPWRKALATCPGSSKNLYIRGVKMLESLIEKYEKEGDEEKMNAYVDTLLSLYDTRIENFGEKGKVLGMKGVDMMKYRKDDPKAAFETLEQAYELEKTNLGPAGVVYMFLAKYYMYANKMAKKTELIELYPKLTEVVNYNKEHNERYASSYEKAGENLDKYFSKIANCEDLVNLYGPKLEGMKDSADDLKQLLKVLDMRGCDDDPLYMDAAVALNGLEPSAESSFSIAIGMLKKNQYSGAIEYFNKAIELGVQDEKKYESYINIGKAQLVQKNYQAAKTAAAKALEIRDNSGEAYLIMGDAFGYGGKDCGTKKCDKKAGWWLAVDYYAKAKSVEESVSEKANQKIGSAKSQFPGKEDCFFEGYQEGQSFTFEDCWITETTTVKFK